MSRKNAELAAVRRDAERKHGELKAAIDKLEEQLAVAVANADNVRRQSEDQFQMVMTKQLDNLFEQSAQQREDLVREHQEKVGELKEAHKKDLDLLKAEQKRADELKCCIQQEKLRSSELENELKNLKLQLMKAYEHQTNLQSAVDVLTETLKNEKLNFEAQIDSQNANIEANHAKEIAELKSNWDSEMEQLTKEHDRTIRDLNETVRRLQDEVSECPMQLS
ncbi:hypothetical protein FBUS_01867 [Fasciolopsis buskii]|uniref:Uncharacterized protein n=1 Tax=Fasciolopsis buskii TaxID=27845 RepID=A0A8E0VPB3_9TREM|nr:hypothetical protein FBUS_01867 [Fasciolopsis buski]